MSRSRDTRGLHIVDDRHGLSGGGELGGVEPNGHHAPAEHISKITTGQIAGVAAGRNDGLAFTGFQVLHHNAGLFPADLRIGAGVADGEQYGFAARQHTGSMQNFTAPGLDDGLGRSTLGGHSHDALCALSEHDLVVRAPAHTEGLVGIADGHGSATRRRNSFQQRSV